MLDGASLIQPTSNIYCFCGDSACWALLPNLLAQYIGTRAIKLHHATDALTRVYRTTLRVPMLMLEYIFNRLL